MRVGIFLKMDERKLRNLYADNETICEYAQIFNILHDHGFIYRGPLERGFINEKATFEDAKNAIKDLFEKLDWFDDCVLKCEYFKAPKPVDFTEEFHRRVKELKESKKSEDK